MQDTPSKPPAVKGRKSLVGILRVVLALSLLALAVSVPRLFKKSSPEPTPQAAVEPTAPEPTTGPPRVRSKAWLAAHKTDRFARAPARDADRAALIGASNLWASVASPTRSGYLIAARLPELRAGIDGVLARFEPPVFTLRSFAINQKSQPFIKAKLGILG